MKRTRATTKKTQSPVIKVDRKIKPLTRLLLFVRAGGHCEFDGCNDYLLEHHVTLTEGIFGQMAHIVAFKPDGPRGRSGLRPSDINNVENLMLLCPKCHKEIDDKPRAYPRATLEQYKKAHEAWVRYVTEHGPDRKTAVLVLKAPINGQAVAVPFGQMIEATAPRYPLSRQGVTIDLTTIADTGPGFIAAATETIKRDVERCFALGGEVFKAQHLSVFALAPIALLVFLGRQLTSKVSADFYQRHRDTEAWAWKRTGKRVTYQVRERKVGPGDKVALLLSLSGTISLDDLPHGVDYGAIYEITLAGATPSPTFLRRRDDLDAFRLAYQEVIGLIVKNHGAITAIDLFPAVPAPIAILCGRELLPKVHPALRVYDRTKVGFHFVLEV